MANNLYISEYATLPVVGGNTLPIAVEPSIAEQVVTFTTHTESSAFNGRTQVIRVHNDGGSPCSIQIGAAPVATTSMKRMAANQTEYFFLGQSGANAMKISVVSNT